VEGPGDDARPVAPTPENVDRLAEGKLRLRQRPGSRNALGPVAFIFPNDMNVYMHGTPAPELFSRTRRDFSHGCVRVEDPLALAAWALKDQPEWTREAILAAMKGTPAFRVPLTRPIRVVMYYVTAAVMPEDNSVHFVEDIYGHDSRLERALAARRKIP
jgi:murein L,D-transpeptidase YcbB/YkuD